MLKQKYYLDHLDKEYLEIFLDRFWRTVVSELDEESGAVFLIFHLSVRDFTYVSKLLVITNTSESKDYLYKHILGGPIGSYLNMNESIYIGKKGECYIQYDY